MFTRCRWIVFALVLAGSAGMPVIGQQKKEERFLDPIDVKVPHISTDKAVKYDYDIVYVRTPRKGDKARSAWTEIAHPAIMDAQGDLMLLHPDGKEELLVAGGADGSVTDPYVSFDGEWVFYSHLKGLKGTSQHGQPPFQGADIFKINVKTRKIVQLTHQEWTPNTGAAKWASDMRKPEKDKTHLNYGVLNMGPCPLPGGRLIFTSNRNAFKPPHHPSPCLQLFVMDDDGKNVEMIGHLNIGMALHPVILKDGRVIFSSLESQGLRSSILWGLWIIHPDGTNWNPVLSALLPGEGAPNAFHFQSQISSGHIIAEEYYNQNNSGFGGYYKLLPPALGAYADPSASDIQRPYAFGPGWLGDPRNPPLRNGRNSNGLGRYSRLPFSPFGIESFTRFATFGEGPADPSVRDQKDSPAVGKVTHPSGAPDNHLLTCYTPGPANHQYAHYPMPDGGIYLIKDGKPIDEPAQMRLIKNDPNYNEQWPRAVVPYQRIFGVAEPARLKPLANDGELSPHLPVGTPYGLVGTSSFYKRESYPGGGVAKGSVTAGYMGKTKGGYEGLDPFNTSENGASMNWVNQGADAGKYANDDIHAVRILVMEPTTDRQNGFKSGRRFFSHAQERLRILGEIPLRHFGALDAGKGKQPIDTNGNPDTSFLAKIPANVAFTFQTLDRHGMVLNMAQTWHQVRPGEVRNDCGGCHAHSQAPTPFEHSAAHMKEYQVFDLTTKTPLLTTKAKDESKRQWDVKDETGLRFVSPSPSGRGVGGEGTVKNAEYFRDIKPLLDRSCAACHTGEDAPAKLVLDDDTKINPPNSGVSVPGTYYRLAMDHDAKFGHKPVIHNGQWRQTNASRYIRKFQSRRSLLTWKIFGERLDGWCNDDFPTEKVPGNADTLMWKGKPIANTSQNRNLADLDYLPPQCPPQDGKVPPLTDEEKRTFVRWIDLGCPIDLDYDPANPQARGYGWMLDDNRPTLTLTQPTPNASKDLSRILIGMHDYDSGLDMKSFTVSADFAIDGVKAGDNLASRFKGVGQGVMEYRLTTPIAKLERGVLTVSVRDRQGNETRIVRTISVGAK